MSIKPVLLWTIRLLIFTCGSTLPLAVKTRHLLKNLQSLPRDPETKCPVFRYGDMYTIEGCLCTMLPRNYSIEGNTFAIKMTKLTELHPKAFENYSYLTSLTISTNSELRSIYPGAFEGMVNLITLDISDNIQLFYLHEGIFTGLKNLKSLSLVKNSFSTIYYLMHAVRPEILPVLEYLDISKNSFGEILYNETIDLEGSSIETLRLSYCGLNDMDSNALSMLRNLSAIWIDNNNMKTETVQSLILNLANSSEKFDEVHIGSNYFSDPNIILKSIAATNISVVDISNSHIFTLNLQVIPSSPSIKYLDFSGSLASKFEMDYFTADKLPNVESLYLAHNLLLDRHFALNLPKLRVLDLSDNCNVIGCASLIEHGRFLLNDSANLEILKLDSNSIYAVTTILLRGLFNLKELRLSNASIQRIEIGAFSDLHQLEILDLSNNILTRNIEINNMTFKGLVNLKVLHLDQSGLTCLEDPNTFQHTPHLEVLTLRQNTFLELHHTLLCTFETTKFSGFESKFLSKLERKDIARQSKYGSC
uniref:Insulin-like growth factor-binding protein complex acid labile subunit n=1 Tax=Lygus hesperus TaxID=30085 RepID=A0A0K8T4F7_LYGHE